MTILTDIQNKNEQQKTAFSLFLEFIDKDHHTYNLS